MARAARGPNNKAQQDAAKASLAKILEVLRRHENEVTETLFPATTAVRPDAALAIGQLLGHIRTCHALASRDLYDMGMARIEEEAVNQGTLA